MVSQRCLAAYRRDDVAEARTALTFSDRASTLVLQATPLCNLRCTYCYLPDLSDRARMDPAITRRLAHDLASYPPGHQVEILWHGGEPLTAGIDHLAALMEPFEPLRLDGRLRHALQTNATLLTPAWVALFDRFDVGVGVSLDGPRWANRERRSLSGAESYQRAVHGLELLRESDRRFSVVAVVTPATIPLIVERAGDYLGFFASQNAQEVGFNIVETEGRHMVGAWPVGAVERFWQAMFDAWTRAGGTPRIRDFTQVTRFARWSLDGHRSRPCRDLFPTVTCQGSVVVLSPELAGYSDVRYGDFVVGNILDDSLDDILDGARSASYVQAFLAGVERCRGACPYFDFCLGGEASNRLFEHGDLTAHETTFCRNSRQIPFTTVVVGSNIA